MIRIAVLCNDRLGIPALQYLVQNRLVVAVGTSNRSAEMVMIMKQLSAQSGVPTTIFSKKELEATMAAWLHQHQPDVVLVKTFPYKIPAALLTVPKHGFINFHYAPLPEFRGSNPLFWMIKEQQTKGGVTVHQMDADFDAGPVLLKNEVFIHPEDSFGFCSTQLAYAGLQLTGTLLQSLLSGKLNAQPQPTAKLRWYGRPEPKDFTINWKEMSASEVRALANACNPWLKGAVTRMKGWPVGITSAKPIDVAVDKEIVPGTILQLSAEKGLVVACKDQTAISAEVIYTEEGYFPGYLLGKFGIAVNAVFDA